MKRVEAGSGRDLADIEMPVLRLLEIEEGFAGTRMPARSTTASITHPRRAWTLTLSEDTIAMNCLVLGEATASRRLRRPSTRWPSCGSAKPWRAGCAGNASGLIA